MSVVVLKPLHSLFTHIGTNLSDWIALFAKVDDARKVKIPGYSAIVLDEIASSCVSLSYPANVASVNDVIGPILEDRMRIEDFFGNCRHAFK